MRRLRVDSLTLLLILTLCAATSVAAQAPAVPDTAPRAGAPKSDAQTGRRMRLPLGATLTVTSDGARDEELQFEFDYWNRPVVRIGQDYTLKTGDKVREVLVIFGNATIEGRVDQNVVVILGDAQLSSTAFVDGALLVFGGSATAAAGAVVDEDLVVIGGAVNAPAEFAPGGQHIVIGSSAIGGRLAAVVPWITRGLLWGRPIVPDLPWVWSVVGIVFLVYLVLNLVFDRAVTASTAKLATKPLTTFAVGLLVLLLVGPICVLLIASVIGIAVVPFVICALVVAAILGKASTARWVGMTVMRAPAQDGRLLSLGAFMLGSAVITVAYMVPVLGFLTWGLLGVFGLGATTIAFVSAYRQENPAPSPSPPVVPPVGPGVPPDFPDRGSVIADRESPMGGRALGIGERGAEPAPPMGDAGCVASAPPTGSAAAIPVDLASFPRAAFRDRLAAFVLDTILLVLAAQFLVPNPGTIFLLFLTYHVAFWTWKGTTVGGIVCQLRVVRVDGKPLQFADALVRGLSSIFSVVVLGIGCFWILRDPDQQAWHDKIAGTYVVKVPRNWPL